MVVAYKFPCSPNECRCCFGQSFNGREQLKGSSSKNRLIVIVVGIAIAAVAIDSLSSLPKQNQ